ncbi:hypothetical protein [Actinokineospora globicatena]|uniref:hypothetical protein n=1 Tax=Actinokineospora globicatena TaxID=103729 RepID=UPI0020A4CBA9|nr:hypothetical protein [Actinokineospora globicatena]MCP2302482.1 hypothetical protein [Actinokineospora globicatena]
MSASQQVKGRVDTKPESPPHRPGNQLPETLDELIADCAGIPPELTHHRPVLPTPRGHAPWRVDEACHAQVADLDEYV